MLFLFLSRISRRDGKSETANWSKIKGSRPRTISAADLMWSSWTRPDQTETTGLFFWSISGTVIFKIGKRAHTGHVQNLLGKQLLKSLLPINLFMCRLELRIIGFVIQTDCSDFLFFYERSSRSSRSTNHMFLKSGVPY